MALQGASFKRIQVASALTGGLPPVRDDSVKDQATPAKTRNRPFRLFVTLLWLLVAAWLLGSIVLSVFSEIYFGDGPTPKAPEQIPTSAQEPLQGSPPR